MNPYASGAESVRARVDLLSQGIEAYVAHSESQGEPPNPDRRAWLLANDPQALIAAITAPRGLEGMAEVLPTMTMPCLLYCGDADGFYPGVKECMPHLPNATLATFPGLNHTQTSQASHLVLPPRSGVPEGRGAPGQRHPLTKRRRTSEYLEGNSEEDYGNRIRSGCNS